jgi:hypothetical protein
MSKNIVHKDYFLTDNKSGWKCVPKKLENNKKLEVIVKLNFI